MKKAFVTGATGFVGNHLVPKLVSEGFSVTCLARNPNEKLFSNLNNVFWVRGDILDSVDILANHLAGIDTVFHLAGLIGYKKSLRDQMFQVNVRGTENVLTAAIQAGCPKFVYMSSVAAIGCSFRPDHILNEDSSYNLDGYNFGYFDSKHLAEKKLVEISSRSSIQTYILNPSTIYGPGDSSKSSRSTQVKVAKGKFPFSPPGGVNVVHIDDVVEACIKVTELGKKNRRYILAGENMLIRDVFGLIANFAGVKAPRFVLPKFALYTLGYLGDTLSMLGIFTGFSLETAKIACCYHWFSNARASSELGISFKPSHIAIQDSVKSLLG